MVQNKWQAAAVPLLGTGSGREDSPYKLAMIRHKEEGQVSIVTHSFEALPGKRGPNWPFVVLVALLCNLAVASAAWYLVSVVVG